MTVTSAPALRCSAYTRSQNVDPVGSAGTYAGFVLVELPLPWPRDIGEVAALQSLQALSADRGLRVQALVPVDPDRAPCVVVHGPAETDGWFSGYRRRAAEAGADLTGTVRSLLGDGSEPGPGSGPDVTDVLVCTHGRRDVCCGSSGTELAIELSRPEQQMPGVHVWRTSHTGGHRFAPTFLVLPQGTMWAYADASVVAAVIEHSIPFRDLAGHYRGCAGLGPAPVQALERAVLSEVGWELLDRRRRGFATGEQSTGEGTRYRLEAEGGAWEATVRPGRTLPVPDCMRPLSEARKTETELVVSDLVSV